MVDIYNTDGGRRMWFIYINQKMEDRCGSHILYRRWKTDVVHIYKPEDGRPMWLIYI